MQPVGNYVPPSARNTRPCGTCGASVDTLRAPRVAHRAGVFVYYCSIGCHANRTAIPRLAASASPERAPNGVSVMPTIVETTDMLGLSRESLLPDSSRGTPRSNGPSDGVVYGASASRDGTSTGVVPDHASTVVALVSAFAALLLQEPASLAEPLRVALTGVTTAVCIVLALRSAMHSRRLGGSLAAWLLSVVPSSLLVLAAVGSGGVAVAPALAAATTMATLPTVFAWAIAERARAAHAEVASLLAELPNTARVIRGERVTETPASRVRAGEEVALEAGDAIPVDGVIQTGTGVVLAHAGDAAPRACQPGDALLAGGRVIEGSLRVLATRAGDDVALSRTARILVSSGEMPRAIVLLERWIWLAPLALATIASAGAVMQPVDGSRRITIALLAIAGAPWMAAVPFVRVAFVQAVARCGRRGIFFRDGRAVETTGSVGTVVFCTRGTVTGTQLELVDVVSLGARDERELVAIAAATEEVAREDSIAKAIASYAQRRSIVLEPVRRTTRLQGRGVTGVNAAGELIAVGSRQLLVDDGIGVAVAEEVARAIEGQARVAVFIAIAGRVEGVLGLEDRLRDEARGCVQVLIDHGFEIVLLSGDGRATVEAIGLALDVTNVRPELLPEDRAETVRSLSDGGAHVAVVGRPRTDGAALGAAEVAISLMAAGVAGGETAVALSSDDLRDTVASLLLTRAARERALRCITTCAITAAASVTLCAFVPAVGFLGAWVAGVVSMGATWAVARG